MISGVALALGWSPAPGVAGVVGVLLVIVAGTAAFASLGLLVAGSLRAEATLAAANLIYLLLMACGAVVHPASAYGAFGDAVQWLPSGALGEGMRHALLDGTIAWTGLAVLALWTVLGAAHLAGIQGGPNLSPRRSLVIGPITDTNAFITRGVAANARRFRVVFGMSFTSETDDVSTLQLASVAFGTRQFVIFQAAGTDFELVEQDLDGQTKPKAIGAIDRSGFARYELFVDKNAGLALVLRNGSELGSIPITITLVDADSVRLGATYTAGGAERTLRFDDVGFVAD